MDLWGVPGSNPGGPMNFLLVEVLPNDPIHRIGGELRIFRQLQISERDRSACHLCFRSACYTLNAWNRRFTVDLSGARPRHWKSEFLSIRTMQTTSSTDSHRIVTPDDLKWETVIPGTQIAVVAGDPTKPGPFVIRQKTAAGAMVPAHWHTTTENVTVLQGTFAMGIGEKFDKTKLTRMHPGDFSTVPATVPHFAMPETDVIVQLDAMGPWVTNVVNPADDPRG